MWCRIENNEIKRYSVIPECWKNVIGFNQLSAETHEAEGFYPMQLPEYDSDLQELGNLYFDAVKRIFTYQVTDKDLPTLAEAKAQKIAEIKDAVKGLYQSIQWYLELCRNDNVTIPTALKTRIRVIRTKYEAAKTQINGYTNVVDVIKWKVPYDKIEEIRLDLESVI